jgi:hypothetical protein
LDAKRIIAAALEVGSRTHAKLADATRTAMAALVTDDEVSSMEEEATQQERMELGGIEEVDLDSTSSGEIDES